MALNKDDINTLWDTITPKLYGYLVHLLRDRSLAEDILQTTWMKAIENLSKFEDKTGATFSSWLFAIARNECKQHWRKAGREIPFDSEIHDKVAIDSKEEDKIFADQIISQLSQGDQEVIRLHYIADLPLGEIAKILKINPVAVRVRMHRALNIAKNLFSNKQQHE